jgi:hypothetical protein
MDPDDGIRLNYLFDVPPEGTAHYGFSSALYVWKIVLSDSIIVNVAT